VRTDSRPECWSLAKPFGTHARQRERAAPCQTQCPNSGDIRGWLCLIAQHRKLGLSLDQAYDRAWGKLVQLNPFPSTLGRICPHPCERGCSRTAKDGAVCINATERFLGDWGTARQLSLPMIVRKDCTESVGVIGSGPAGLSFAYQMSRRGYPVTIYEQTELPGGMLRHAIPDYRLPRGVLDAEIQRVLGLQISLVRGIEAGSDIPFADLRARHRVLFLGMGAQAAKHLGVKGEAGPGVLSAIEYLTHRKEGTGHELGKRVVVIGGGNTAMDAARSARRDGAEVTLLYRRRVQEMPAVANEVQDALAEGVRFEFLAAPQRILRDGPRVIGVEVRRMRLEEADDDGRRRTVPIPGAVDAVETDTVLAAVSQMPAWRGFGDVCHENTWLRTSFDGKLADNVWAGGDDCGPGTAGRAIAQGRLAAEAAHAELRREAPTPQRVPPAVDSTSVKPDYYEVVLRGSTRRRPMERWLAEPEMEIEQTLTSEQAFREAARCMSCGLCFGCQQCFMYCNGAGFTRIEEPEPGRYYALALDACEGCGKCIELCPCGYLESREGAVGQPQQMRPG
jgi:NADPH-dependent glutamate synthase beta subunit-like oxidoreductase/Pyruvate/2-oxoacid:ferredoxin oxidoreductase delta subunit